MTAGQVTEPAIQSTRRSFMSLPPQVKYAVYRVTGELTSRCMRKLIEDALTARGWDKARRDSEYVQYAARCAQRGEQNLFPGGRI